MTLLIANYKISSFAGGYKLSRQRGKQWKIMSYHQELVDALTTLFELRVRVDTKQFVIDFSDATHFVAQQEALIAKIQGFKEEILSGVKNGN